MEFPSVQIEDFSGGMTDNFVGRDPQFYQAARNLLINANKKPYVRHGCTVDGNTEDEAKISSPVNLLLAPFTAVENPYRLSTGGNYGKLFYNDTVAQTQTELLGPTGNHMFTTSHGTATDKRFSTAFWNGHYYITSGSLTQKLHKLYRDASDDLQLRTAGLPKPTGTPTFSLDNAAGTFFYRYALVWKYTYTVGLRTFIDRSAPLRATCKTVAAISGANVNSIGGLPTIVNGADDNYDAANILLEIYRTEHNGTEYYLTAVMSMAQLLLGTSASDVNADAALILLQPAYFNGGVVENDPPPVAKFVHVSERGTGYYGYLVDGSDTISSRIRQSVPGDPDSVPGGFFDDIDDEVTGISSFRGIPIAFGKRNIYRMEGAFQRVGPGQMIAKKIDDTTGCVSHTSIVQTEVGLFFAGENGFYWTDGYKVQKISDGLNVTYASFYPATDTARQQRIMGAYDNIERLVYWTFEEVPTQSDGAFVLHLRYGVRPDSTFTFVAGQPNDSAEDSTYYPSTIPATITENFRAKCLLFFNRRMYRGDDRGYVFYFDDTKKTDPRVDVNLPVAQWGTTYIAYELRTSALKFGDDSVRKWTPSALLKLKPRGNVSVQISTDRDLSAQTKKCKEIKHRSDFSWQDAGVLWGDPVLFSDDKSLFEDKRRFPAPGFRCSYRTVIISNSFTVLQKSDNLGLATVNASAKTATLVNAATEDWPPDVLDYYLSFEHDDYSAKFLVTVRADNVLTFSDASNQCPANGNYKWLLRGYAKGEVIEVQSLILPYKRITDTQPVYRQGDEGGNE